ncbi:hypothetical protein FRC02_009145 [Tulasnella sp. 418]|nr:hypothetical protein FRC02_009145 [Tulasnella sp. 418]
MFAVLYPLILIVAIGWHRLRDKDRQGVIALPPDDPEEREALARDRDVSAVENGDGAVQSWAARS